MKIDIGMRLKAGDSCTYKVVALNNKLVLEADFVSSDILLAGFFHPDGYCPDLDKEYDGYLSGCNHSYRSVRIYHLVEKELAIFKPGESIRAETVSVSIADGKTKDGRTKIHVSLSNPRRIYSWYRTVLTSTADDEKFSIEMKCGQRQITVKSWPVSKEIKIGLSGSSVVKVCQVVLPDGVVLSTSLWGTINSSIDSYMQEKKRELGKVVSMKSVNKMVSNLPHVENRSFCRTDRSIVLRKRWELLQAKKEQRRGLA